MGRAASGIGARAHDYGSGTIPCAPRGYVSGPSLSLIGTWVETVARALLVPRLMHSGTVLGLTTAARYAPILPLSPYAGLRAQRHGYPHFHSPAYPHLCRRLSSVFTQIPHRLMHRLFS